MNSVVQIEGVHKIHRRGPETIDVLKGVDLTVSAGKFLALMGPSGSGKTTLLNLMAGIDSPTSGRIVVHGRDISRFNEVKIAACFSMIFV